MKNYFILLIGVVVGLAGYLLDVPENYADHANEVAALVSSHLTGAIQRAEKEASQFKNSKVDQLEWQYYHYLIVNGAVQRWSTNKLVPDPGLFTEPGLRHVRLNRGDFVARTSARSDTMLVSLIPLVEKYRITNRYLHTTWNENIFPTDALTLVGLEESVGAVVQVDQKNLFRIQLQEGERKGSTTSLVVITLGCLLFLFGLYQRIRSLLAERKIGMAIVTWLVLAGLFRLLLVRVGFPRSWLSADLFDPAVFASSSFNASVGDLFLNALYVLVACSLLFGYSPRWTAVRYVLRFRQQRSLWISTFFLLLAFFGLLFPFLFLETIAHNSSIVLDLTKSIAFDAVRGVAFVAVLIGLICSFLFYHVFFRMAVTTTQGRKWLPFLIALSVATALFWLYSISLDRDYRITLSVGVVMAMLLYATGWNRSLSRLSYTTFIYLLSFILLLAGQSALTVRALVEERDHEAMQRFGSNFLVDHDELGEYLLNEASVRIQDDPFIQTRLTNPLLSKGSIRQKIRLYYLNSYFDRYEVKIHLFNASGEPLDNQTSAGFASFILQYQSEADQTNYRGIYFVENLRGEAAKGYVAVMPILRGGRTAGYATLVLTLKKVVPRNVYPQLLVDNRFAQDFNPGEYSFAIFQNDSLLASSGNFDYKRDYSLTVDHDESDSRESIRHVVVAGEHGRKAVVSTLNYRWKQVAANFSFWVLAGVLLIFGWLVVISLYTYRKSRRLNYATRIQLYVYLAFFLPLLAVSVTTLNWTSESALQQLEVLYATKTQLLSEGVADRLERYLEEGMDLNTWEDQFAEAAKLADVDASIYSPSGRLMVTSQPLIFDNQILTKWINPSVLERVAGSTSSFTLEEQVGDLQYNNSYASLRSPRTGRVMGILSVPFFDSANSLEQGRIAIFTNVLIIFVIILIFFTVLSSFATRWLTFPLEMITRSLGKMSLKEENRLLDWETDDEIGLMVKEYNRMVLNLDRSKIELARSQKESAWREMAQQVAHEIKNPLTPMKLTLQQLELTMKAGELSKERTSRALETLLSQLEILNEIASSFSSFAKMPAPLLHRLEVTEQVKKVVQLYQNHPSGTVTMSSQIERGYMLGDEPLLNRLLSNLVLNALQSGEEGAKVDVTITIESDPQYVHVRITDTGAGMDAHTMEKIFVPNFTTKKWGSGLGLAIVRQGVEQMGGSVRVASQKGIGTTFTLLFPLVH